MRSIWFVAVVLIEFASSKMKLHSLSLTSSATKSTRICNLPAGTRDDERIHRIYWGPLLWVWLYTLRNSLVLSAGDPFQFLTKSRDRQTDRQTDRRTLEMYNGHVTSCMQENDQHPASSNSFLAQRYVHVQLTRCTR